MNVNPQLNPSRLVSRLALLSGILGIGFLLAAVGFGIGDDSPQGLQAHPQALNSLGYQTFSFLDGLVWIFAALVIWSLGVFIEPYSPSRGRLASVFGIATLIGAVGGFGRNLAVSGLAASYVTASSAQQTVILYTYSTLYNVIHAIFTTGNFFQSAGQLLAASTLLLIPRFPRWLAALVGFVGVTGGVLFVTEIVAPTSNAFFPILLANVIIGLIVLPFALTWRLWRSATGSMPGS